MDSEQEREFLAEHFFSFRKRTLAECAEWKIKGREDSWGMVAIGQAQSDKGQNKDLAYASVGVNKNGE